MSNSVCCSFCSKTTAEVAKLIAGPDVYICDECVDVCVSVIQAGKPQKQEKQSKSSAMRSPRDIKEFLDDYVIGQDDAKMTVSVAVYNHYKRINSKVTDDVEIEKSNILLIGPSAVGKTKIAETIARILDVPFAIADATTLTETGYVGEDVESIIFRLLQAADMKVEAAEKGIVFIDEIDKLRKRATTGAKDVSGEGVQQALLKLLEGSEIMVPAGGKRGSNGESVKLNTRNILFICGGAFSGINDEESARIGLMVDRETVAKTAEIDTERLIKYGMIPELVGRLPVVAVLNELTEDELVRVLTEPKNSIVRQYQKLFAMDSVKLTFEDSALRTIAREARKRKTGARGLRGVIEKMLLKMQYELPGLAAGGVKEIFISEDVILNGAPPRMLMKRVRKKAASG